MVREMLLLFVPLFLLGGCANLMPSGHEKTVTGNQRTPNVEWQSFADAQAVKEAIVPGVTTEDDLLHKFGIKIDGSNAYAYSHVEFINLFFPGGKNGNSIRYDEAVHECMDEKAGCKLYAKSAAWVDRQADGSLFKRVIGFESEETIKESVANMLFLMRKKDGSGPRVIVYRDLSGTPDGKVRHVSKKNPLFILRVAPVGGMKLQSE